LTVLPESLGQLAALTTLNLSWCLALTALPESLGQLAALTTLDLSAVSRVDGAARVVGPAGGADDAAISASVAR
jgi:leucine-rich repeat protein SHOC2